MMELGEMKSPSPSGPASYFWKVKGLVNAHAVKGYDVVFSEGKAFLRRKTTGENQKIGVRTKNLYQLQVDGCAAMACKAGEVVKIGRASCRERV